MTPSRFYTADDFDVHFSRRVPGHFREFYSKGRLIARVKIGEPFQNEGWDEVRFNPADRCVCLETPQERRRRTP